MRYRPNLHNVRFHLLLLLATILGGTRLVGTILAQEIDGASRGNSVAEDRTHPFVVVCSTTQLADFARQIVGDRWRVDCVLAPGEDPHLFEAKPNHVAMTRDADLCIANGWGLEGGSRSGEGGWMQKMAEDSQKPMILGVTGITPLKLENVGESHDTRDPHAWFTPKNAGFYVRNIVKGISSIDPPHTAEYEARAELYLRQLQVLDAWIQRQVSAIPPERRILVTSHDAFGYFCQAYGFRSAAPEGWSTGAEVGGGVTNERRQKTIDSIRNLGVKSIFVETSVNKELIKVIADEAQVAIGGELYSDSMGTAGSAGETYLGMMRENVLRIVTGLK